MSCEYGHGRCTAPGTICPHWQGIFCEYDSVWDKIEKPVQAIADINGFVAAHPEVIERAAEQYMSQFVDVNDVVLEDEVIRGEEK